MSRSVIVSAVRTPFGKLGGGLAGVPGDRARRDRDPRRARPRRGRGRRGRVRDHGPGAAGRRRPGARAPGGDRRRPADRACLRTRSTRSARRSIRAVEIADQMIRAGRRTASIVAGGMESMSNAPYALKKARFGYRLGDGTLIDLMIHDGLTSTFDNAAHGRAGVVRLARARDLARGPGRVGAALARARGEGDRRGALRSDEIVPVGDFAVDEGPRRDTSLEKLASLKPVFDPEGTTTAGQRAWA